jgi:hypothetical protein
MSSKKNTERQKRLNNHGWQKPEFHLPEPGQTIILVMTNNSVQVQTYNPQDHSWYMDYVKYWIVFPEEDYLPL